MDHSRLPSLFRTIVLLCAALSNGAYAAGQTTPPGGVANQNPPASSAPSDASIAKAATILADTRQALGGEKLAAINTLLATGRTRRVRGNNLVPIEFEIAIGLPDRYVRKDEIPAEESDPTSIGFSGPDLIQFPVPAVPTPPPGRGGAPPSAAQLDAQRKQRVAVLKQEFVRLALGLFSTSLTVYPVTFSYAAQAEAPQGTAHVLDVKGEGGLAARFFIDTQTHLPLMVSWQAPPTSVIVRTSGAAAPGSVPAGAVVIDGPPAPPAGATDEDKQAYAKTLADLRRKAQATPVEHRLYFADYRDVEGVKLPFRLRRAIGVDTTEETTFDRFRINAKIDERKFHIAK